MSKETPVSSEATKTAIKLPEPDQSVPAEQKATDKNTSSADHSKSGTSKTAIVLSSIALILGAGGLALGWVALEKSNTPITFLGGGQDGNSANFTDGSIADVANKVSPSVVSITTERFKDF